MIQFPAIQFIIIICCIDIAAMIVLGSHFLYELIKIENIQKTF